MYKPLPQLQEQAPRTKASLKEQVQHGTKGFPFQVYTGYNDLAQKVTNHWHEEMELIWMPAPGGKVFIGDKRYSTRFGALYFVHPGEVHAWDSRGQASAKTVAIVFHWRLLSLVSGSVKEAVLQPLAMGKARLPTFIEPKKGWRSEVCDQAQRMAAEFAERRPGWELAVTARLFNLLALAHANGAISSSDVEPNKRQEQRMDRIKMAMQHIYDHYAEKITLEQLARQAGLSPFHFTRQFKTLTHQTPVNFLNRFRIERATELLKDPDRKILDVALDVGFSHLSYFNKTFRRFQGCTPSEFRATLL